MGQVTVFEKDNCLYCKQVLTLLKKFRICVLNELESSPKIDDLNPEIDIVTIDCGEEVAYGSFCIRTTGSLTVPHVFFNEEYVGGAKEFLTLDATCEGGYNVLRSKLLHLAKSPKPNPAFPPTPDAALVKITEKLAFSSQLSNKQLEAFSSFGVKTVLNISNPNSPAFSQLEKEILGKNKLLTYIEIPLYVVTRDNIIRVMKSIQSLPTPILVHDDIGTKAGLVVLLSAAKLLKKSQPNMDVSTKTVLGWGKDVGINIQPYEKEVSQILDFKFSDQNSSSSSLKV